MTRKPKTSEAQTTEGVSKDSLEGAEPEQAETPIPPDPQEQAAAPAAGGDPSAANADAEQGGADAAPRLAVADPRGGATVMVVCHRDGGRRRAGRRWDAGETILPVDALTPYDLAQLQGDPQFTVKLA